MLMENAYEKCLRGAKKMVVPVMLFSVGWTAVSLEAFAEINENASFFEVKQVSDTEGKVVDVMVSRLLGQV